MGSIHTEIVGELQSCAGHEQLAPSSVSRGPDSARRVRHFVRDPSPPLALRCRHQLYGRHAEERKAGGINSYEYVIGFTGASSIKYPLRQSIIRLIRSLRVKAYLGTWQQTALKTTHNNSWKALDREGYVRQISLTKMWVSTTGPSNIVGTRYFEVLASGTTMLLCNKAPSGVYDGLFEDGVHAVVFDGMDDLRSKILYYSNNDCTTGNRRCCICPHKTDSQLGHPRAVHHQGHSSCCAASRPEAALLFAASQCSPPSGAVPRLPRRPAQRFSLRRDCCASSPSTLHGRVVR